MEPSSLDILNAAVRIAVGERAEPRPGQVAATLRISDALETRSHAAAIAPTGSGKSFTLLSAGAERVVGANERVIISTESLGLQKQILEKDAPVVAAAVKELYDFDLRVAVLKGTNNYIDPRALIATAAIVANLEEVQLDLTEWVAQVEAVPPYVAAARIKEALGVDVDGENVHALLLWALAQQQDTEAPGDRHSCPVDVRSHEWDLISASSAEAAPEDYWLYSKCRQARSLIADAHIVVVNHTLLAIQAAKAVKIVIGNANFGEFHHILVDEAHALPSEVRNQGANTVSARVINSIARGVSRIAVHTENWAADGQFIADTLTESLLHTLGNKDSVRLGNNDNPLARVGAALDTWISRGKDYVKPAIKSKDTRTSIAAQRLDSRLDELRAAARSIEAHRKGEARWVESVTTARGTAVAAQSSPVDVSSKLRNTLWFEYGEEGEEPRPLGVVCVSATLPPGFTIQAGLSTQVVDFPSPFAEAYAHSALYIPMGTEYRDELMLPNRWSSTPKFDVTAHRGWAAKQIVQLVTANGGGALVLAATAENGKAYVEQLRAATNLTIYSQWDGGTPAALLDRWRADTTSVLVGTRSLMTGVDAPGETCSLVILDRIPRSPSNPIDDARLEDMMERAQLDKWSADRFVYAADAALLTAQAAGRLIRSASDRGMVAVLDPRLLKYKQGGFTGYQEPTRLVYMAPLYPFQVRMTDLGQATAWLRNRAVD